MTTGIRIENYDPAWPRTYAREGAGIVRALPTTILAIEHVGSTSIQGLAAKPIVDIMAGIQRLSDAAAGIEALRTIGYEFQPAVVRRLPDTRLFVKWSRGREAVHLHLAEYGGAFWCEKLLFRNYLRAHPDVAQEYAALKRSLAPLFSEAPPYSEAKTDFIQAVLARARRPSGRPAAGARDRSAARSCV